MATPHPDLSFQPLTVRSKQMITPEICLFELTLPDGGPLPPFEAGAHVTVQTPAGARRTYSLCNDPDETHRYVLGVKAEQAGRGGSLSLVRSVQAGDRLQVSAPANQFPLLPAPDYLFIAGGIGITPILSMARQLVRTGAAPFRLVYCARSPELTAFRDELTAPPFAEHVTLYHDGGDPERVFDFWPLLERPSGTHIYCCGPQALMEDVRGMTGHWPPGNVHFEDFASNVAAVRPADVAFTVRHAGTGETVTIPAHRSILDTLREHGHALPSSCESGVCGTCRMRLVAGEVEHRDRVLRDDERDRYIMVCVSRARSPELVLDW